MIINGKLIKVKDLVKVVGVFCLIVIKYYGISCENYERVVIERRKFVFELRVLGLKWKEVVEKMNMIKYSVIVYYR